MTLAEVETPGEQIMTDHLQPPNTRSSETFATLAAFCQGSPPGHFLTCKRLGLACRRISNGNAHERGYYASNMRPNLLGHITHHA
jgi:hypothetical protein